MEAYIVDWLNLLVRWLHVIAGVAWIGASFYFIWLDDHLAAPKDPADDAKGVGGEVWSVHGGGFYHAQKYKIAPQQLPERLHWFKWEAYTTWMSGMLLLALVYWYGAEVYLIDPSVADLSVSAAVGIAITFLSPGFVTVQNFFQSVLVNSRRTSSITEAVFARFGAMLAIMGIGIVLSRMMGVYVIAIATIVGSLVQIVWLKLRSASDRRRLVERDSMLSEQIDEKAEFQPAV